MKVAIVGTRGIPAAYGGFETFAEELAKRLVERGHEVVVYCRQKYSAGTYLGARLVYLPTIRHKYLETMAHTYVSTLHLTANPCDVALYCNAANALFTIFPRIARIPVALNVDGLERKRKKWNALAKSWYRLSEWLATKLPTSVVSDALNIQQYYRERYGKQTHFIPYGAETGKVSSTKALEALGLEPGRYFLYVSRMEPENNALLVREAFEGVQTDMKLALVGDAPYAPDYIRKVRDTRDSRVVMPGAIYGDGYKELQSHCFAYIHATEVGGTHPALIEAMGRGALTLFLETPENSEVAARVAIPFRHDDLRRQLQWTTQAPQAELDALREAAQTRVQQKYSWDAVTDAYEQLLESLIR